MEGQPLQHQMVMLRRVSEARMKPMHRARISRKAIPPLWLGKVIVWVVGMDGVWKRGLCEFYSVCGM